jgi:DNA-binding CsgD family transcriptional regulator
VYRHWFGMATSVASGPRAGELLGRRRERAVLDGLIDAVRRGESRALMVHGEPGIGKTALLGYAVERASGCLVARAAGVPSEMELPYAGLHQLLMPVLDLAERLPAPQRDALLTAFAIVSPSRPQDRFVVGLAVLGLLSDAAEQRPMICVVDDLHWMDRASAQALAFVARRLQAESIGLVFAGRAPSADLDGVPELVVHGLPDGDAGALLDLALTGTLDAQVREQLLSEAHGNPLALLELSRGLSVTELAGGFGLPGAGPLSGRIEESFARRLEALPRASRRLLQVVAADPVGEPLVVWRAAEALNIPAEAAAPAVEAGLIEFGFRVRFRHPLARSATYRSASFEERREVHRALGEVIDGAADPDRRAWHRALAASRPDEAVASELESSAGRAQLRGGLAAASAFLERAAALTPEPADRARRLVAAARAKRDAGALDEALALLAAVGSASDPLRTAEVERLRGQIALEQGSSDAARLLVNAAKRLEPLDADVARETHLEALGAAMAGDLSLPGGALAAARAARAAPPGPQPPRVVDVLLDAFAVRLTEGYAPAVPKLTKALELLLALDTVDDETAGWRWLAGGRAAAITALELWDADAFHLLAAREVERARDTGAVGHLQLALNLLARSHLLAGELSAAEQLIEEEHVIAEVTGSPHLNSETTLRALRGEEPVPPGAGIGALETAGDRTPDLYAMAVLNNGLGRHDAARDVAHRLFGSDRVGYGAVVVPELAEAASRTGHRALLVAASQWLAERTAVTPTPWALGIDARVRALLGEGDNAEELYRESIDALAGTRVRLELARAHLLYGEWLRRQRRRADARTELRHAHTMLEDMGAAAFAARARRELLATGETARKRSIETRSELTAQEAQIARLAREGLSNPEIGTRLFISPRTVQYHLSKVFAKLDISSRNELHLVLPAEPPASE